MGLARHRIGLSLLLLAACAFYLVKASQYFVGFYNDDVIYVSLARALAQGLGYRDLALVGTPLHTRYPPLYPVLLMPLSGSVVAMRALSLALDLVNVGLVWVLLSGTALPLRAWVCAMTAFNAVWVAESTAVMSEPLFTALLLVWLVLWRRLAPRPSRGALAVLGVVSGLAYGVRTIAVVMPVVSLWMLRRRWRDALPYLAGWAVAVAPFVHAGKNYANYVTTDVRALLVQDVALYFSHLPACLLGAWNQAWALHHGTYPAPAWGYLAGAAVWACFLAGLTRPDAVLPGFRPLLLAYYAVLAAWPFPDLRFSVPVLPLLYYFVGSGLCRLRGATWVLGALVVLQIGLVATLQPPWSAHVEAQTYGWIQANVPPGDAFAATNAAVWLYTGHRLVPVPAFQRAPETALFELYRDHIGWVLMEPDYTGAPVDPAAIAWLDGHARRFERVMTNPQESTWVYRIRPDEHYVEAVGLFTQGVQAMQRGDTAAAKAALTECLRLEPDFEPARRAMPPPGP